SRGRSRTVPRPLHSRSFAIPWRGRATVIGTRATSAPCLPGRRPFGRIPGQGEVSLPVQPCRDILDEPRPFLQRYVGVGGSRRSKALVVTRHLRDGTDEGLRPAATVPPGRQRDPITSELQLLDMGRRLFGARRLVFIPEQLVGQLV